MRVQFIIQLAAWLALHVVGTVRAEPFADLYGGWSKSRNTDISASQRTCFLVNCTTSAQTIQSLIFQHGLTAGGREGYWFDRLSWFGVAGDVSYYRTSSASVQLDSVSLSPTPMLRVPLWTTPERPHRHVQPYLGAGPYACLPSRVGRFSARITDCSERLVSCGGMDGAGRARRPDFSTRCTLQ